MNQVELNVTGMHCPKCEARIVKHVGALDGVSSVQANHQNDSVIIEWETTEPKMSEVSEVIESLGFVIVK